MKYTVSYKELLLNDGYILREDLFDTKVKQGYYKIDENDPIYLTFTGKGISPGVYATIYKIFKAQSKVEKEKAVEIGALSKLGLYFLLSGLLIHSSLSKAKHTIITKQKIDELKRKAEVVKSSVQYISDDDQDETTKTDPLESLLSETYKMIFEENGSEDKKTKDPVMTQILRSLKLLITVKKISYDISEKVASMYFGSTRIIYLIATVGIMFFSYLLISLGILMIKKDVWEMKELQDGLKAICSNMYTKASEIHYSSKTDFFKGISKIFWSFLVSATKNLPAAIASSLSGIWNAIKRIPEMIKSFFSSGEKKEEGFLVAGDTILLRETTVLKEAINLGIFGTIGNALKKILKFIFSRYGLLAIGVLIVIKAFMSVPSGTEIDGIYKSLVNDTTQVVEKTKEELFDEEKQRLENKIKELKGLINNSSLAKDEKDKLSRRADEIKEKINDAKNDGNFGGIDEEIEGLQKEFGELEAKAKMPSALKMSKKYLKMQIEELEDSINKNTSADNTIKQAYLDRIKQISLNVDEVKNADDVKKIQSELDELKKQLKKYVS